MYNKHSSCHVNSCTPVVGSQRAREAAAKCEGDGEMWGDVGVWGGQNMTGQRLGEVSAKVSCQRFTERRVDGGGRGRK